MQEDPQFDLVKVKVVLDYIFSKIHILNMQDMFDYFVGTFNIDVYKFNEFVNLLYIHARSNIKN
jgi:hypothetical protein